MREHAYHSKKKSLEGVKNKMKEHIHSRIAKILVVLALAVVASVMFVFVGCSSECAHENTHEVTLATATCTSEGTVQTVCDKCNEVIKTEHPAALGHDWDEGTVVAATCTAGGYTLQTCSRCDATRQINPTEPVEHQWKDTTVVAATCTAGGYTLQTCELCGATRETNPTNALGHTWEAISQAATCGEAGYTAQKCSVCGAIQGMQTIPATGNHTWVAGKTVAATCVTDGYTEYTCSVCGATKQEITQKATGHKWVNDKVLVEEATCTENGYYYLECANCDERQTLDVIEPLGHDYEWSVATALTCTTDGTIEGVCSRCDATVTYTADQYAAMTDEQKAALALDEKLIADNSSANGFLQASGHNYISVLNINGYADTKHDYDVPSAGGHDDTLYHVCQDIGILNAGTENEVDYTGYSLVCTECDVAVATADHTKDNPNAFACEDNDDTDNGIAWTCTVCGYEQKEEPHKPVMVEIATGEPAAEGTVYSCLYKMVCSVCGTVTDEEGPHTMPTSEDKYYVANCQHGNLCVTCGKDVFGGKLAHKIVKLEAGETVNGATAVEATCTTKGLDVYYCETCAALEADEEYPFEVKWTTIPTKEAEALPVVAGTAGVSETSVGNFYTKTVNGTAHTYETVYVSANADDPNLIYCTSDFYKKDVCTECGTVRVDDTTDKNGLYGLTEGFDSHNYKIDYDLSRYTDAEGNKLPGMEKFALPTCSSNGWFLQVCDNCLKTDNKTQCGTSTWVEVTLEQYAAELGKTTTDLLADQAYHAETMFVCGHPYCPACVPKDQHHGELQWSVSFQFAWDQAYDVELPTLDTFTAYYCWIDTVNMKNFADYRAAFEAKYPDYTFAYYTDADHKTLADFDVIGADSGDDQYTGRITLYVEVAADNALRFTGNWLWYTGAQLDVNINFNNNFIPAADIDSIYVEIIDEDGGAEGAELVLATALSTNADGSVTLANLMKAAAEWSNPWLDENGECVLTIGHFCDPNFTAEEGAEEWTFTQDESFNESSAYVADGVLTGVLVRCTVTVGDATYVTEVNLAA